MYAIFDFMQKGTVYLLKNEYMPNVYKIGMTTLDIKNRIKSLRNTSLPADFILVDSYNSDYVSQLERHVHKKLVQYRIKQGREFFLFKNDEYAIEMFRKHFTSFVPNENEVDKSRRYKRDGISSAAHICREAGLESLAEVSRMTKVSVQTLHNWHKSKPELFGIVIDGCAYRKSLNEMP